jgi:quercetin dioxygenase-like cupin family protein
MPQFSLDDLANEHLQLAASSVGGRSAATVFGGGDYALCQTVIALTAGSLLKEHQSPGDATLLVLRGRTRLVARDASWEGRSGDLIVIPSARHSLVALEDSVVLLTFAK